MLYSLSSPWPPLPSLLSLAARTTDHRRRNHIQVHLPTLTFLLTCPRPTSTFTKIKLPYSTKSVAGRPTCNDFNLYYRRSPASASESDALTSAAIERKQGSQSDGIDNSLWIRLLIERIKELPGPERCKFLNQIELDTAALIKTVDDFNDFLIGLLVAEEHDLALKLFDKMPQRGLSPDSWTYSIVIRTYSEKGQPFVAKQLLDHMIEKGFRPNVITLTILINSFCRKGRMQKAFEVFEEMVDMGCDPKVRAYNCLLKGLCFVGRVEEAYHLLMKMQGKGQENYDIYSFTTVMDGLCKVGRSDEAKELLEEAIQMGLTPNVITYNTLFHGYSKEGKPSKGIALLKLMKRQGCTPDHISYSTLMHGLLKWGKIRPAFWVYKELVETGLKADERTMNVLLREMCRKTWREEMALNDVYLVFEKMKNWGCAIFPSTHYLMIHTFCVGNEIDKALVNLHEMVKNGHFPRMVTINRIIRGLCEERRVGEALSVLVLVAESSRIPSKISYNLLIDEFRRRGDMLGACNVYGAALKLGVTPHKKPRHHRSQYLQ